MIKTTELNHKEVANITGGIDLTNGASLLGMAVGAFVAVSISNNRMARIAIEQMAAITWERLVYPPDKIDEGVRIFISNELPANFLITATCLISFTLAGNAIGNLIN